MNPTVLRGLWLSAALNFGLLYASTTVIPTITTPDLPLPSAQVEEVVLLETIKTLGSGNFARPGNQFGEKFRALQPQLTQQAALAKLTASPVIMLSVQFLAKKQ